MAEAHISKKTYWMVFAALMVLLFLTVFIAYMHIDPILGIVIAMLIAFIKAALVILYFMHVKINSRLTQLIVISGFAWLIILIGITLTDYKTRDWQQGYGYSEHVDQFSSPYGIPTTDLPQNRPGAVDQHAGEHGAESNDAPEMNEIGE